MNSVAEVMPPRAEPGEGLLRSLHDGPLRARRLPAGRLSAVRPAGQVLPGPAQFLVFILEAVKFPICSPSRMPFLIDGI